MLKRSGELTKINIKKKMCKVNSLKESEISFEELEDFSSGEESPGSLKSNELNSSEIESSSDSEDDSVLTSINKLQRPISHHWKKINPPEQAKNIKSEFIMSKTGPFKIENCEHPIDFLNLFLSESVYMIMVHHSNAYARHRMQQEKLTKYSRLSYWHDITIEEMKKFISILISMGIIRRPSLADYWNTKPTQFIPFYSKVMSLQRFQVIHSVFNLTTDFSTTRGSSDGDVCKNVNELLTALNDSFKRYFVPGQDITVSESVIGSKKHTYVQYVPSKNNTQHNIKKIDLCDSSSGYVFHSALIKYKDRRVAGLLAKRVVMEVLNEAELTGKGYHIFTDNTYTSIGLSQDLLAANTFLTGIISKKFSELKPTTTRPTSRTGYATYYRKGDHLMIEYKNMATKKSVHMLSTGSYAANRLVITKKGKEKVVPLPVYLYNKQKINTDKKHKSSHITCSRMTRVCWKRIVYNLIDLSIYNAFVLYQANTSTDRQVSRMQFVLDIVEKLAFQNALTGSVDSGTNHLLLLPGLKTQICNVCQKSKARHYCSCCNNGFHPECFNELDHLYASN